MLQWGEKQRNAGALLKGDRNTIYPPVYMQFGQAHVVRTADQLLGV